MKLKIAILVMQLALLAGCSGDGESDSGASNDAVMPPQTDPAAEKPPIAEDPADKDPVDEDPADEDSGAEPLSLTCSATPASGLAFSAEQVSAKFKFSKKFTGSATILAAENGTLVIPETVSIDGDELIVNRKTPASGFEKYSIRLRLQGPNVLGPSLTAVCTWSLALA